jgi:ferredoxin
MRRALKMVVDPVSCAGEGLCAELFPERITLDPWGYPIVSDEPLTPQLMEHARRAVDMCPHLAIHVMDAPVRVPTPTRRGAEGPGPEPTRAEARVVAQLRGGGPRR